MKIVLMRHGEAESVSLAEGDRQRNLTEKGIDDIHKIGSFIRNSKIKITCIYHSPFNRTKQSADILAEELQMENRVVSSEELCSGGDCSNLLPNLCSYTNSDAIIVVGHNPEIAYFASKLLGQTCEDNLIFSPGTSIALNVPKEKFTKGQILWVVSPDFLPTHNSSSIPAIV